MSGQKSRDTVYVRIDPEVRQSFQRFVLGHKKEGVSEKRVIERLLRDFMSLSDDERMGVLRSERVDPVGVFGDLIYQFTWADHAFSTGQWAWAIEEYRRLREMAAAAPGLRLISTYKLGYSWLDVSNSLRREAVMQPSSEKRRATYDAGLKAVRVALEYNNEFLEMDPTRPVVVYNIACCHSLAAQLTVERILTEENPRVLEALRSVVENDESAWESATRGWPEFIADKSEAFAESTRRSVQQHAQRSIEALDRVLELRHDPGMVIRRADDDSDLLFIREDPMICEQYATWRMSAGQGGGGDESFLHSFQELHASLEESIKSRVEGP